MTKYYFDHWTINETPVGNNNPMTVVIEKTQEITAIYKSETPQPPQIPPIAIIGGLAVVAGIYFLSHR